MVHRSLLQDLSLAVAAWVLCAACGAQDRERTFLTGGELAARVLENVVIIRVEDAEIGSGFVIGEHDGELFVVTALHVLTGEGEMAFGDGELRPSSVRFCKLGDSGEITIDPASVMLVDRLHDIAVFRLPAPADYMPRLKLLATDKPVGTNRIWSVGRDGECVIADNAAVEEPEDSERNLIISHGGRGGTSGAPAMSGQGIVGLVWSTADGVNVIARSIGHIRELVLAKPEISWSLEESHNVPPLTREAAEWDLSAALNDYVFNLKNVRDALVKKVVRGPEYEGVVARYNTAITTFNEVKDRHDGTFASHWGREMLDRYSSLRSRVEATHSVVYSLNRWTQDVRDSNQVPRAIRKRMKKLSPEVEKLDADIKQFLRAMKQP